MMYAGKKEHYIRSVSWFDFYLSTYWLELELDSLPAAARSIRVVAHSVPGESISADIDPVLEHCLITQGHVSGREHKLNLVRPENAAGAQNDPACGVWPVDAEASIVCQLRYYLVRGEANLFSLSDGVL